MISETLLLLMLLASVFLAGAAVGQLVFRYRLAKLERSNLILEQKRLDELKSMLKSKALVIERHHARNFEQEVRAQIDDLFKDLDNK